MYGVVCKLCRNLRILSKLLNLVYRPLYSKHAYLVYLLGPKRQKYAYIIDEEPLCFPVEMDKRIYKTDIQFWDDSGSRGCTEKEIQTAISMLLLRSVFFIFSSPKKYFKFFFVRL